MKAINKQKVISIVIAIFIIQFGLFFIIRETDKKQESKEIERLRLEELFGVEFNYNLQPKVVNLNLCCKNWSAIPPELFTFKNIKSINLSKNNLKKFPYELLEMPNLITLNLENNLIQEIDFKQKNQSLLSLFLSHNEIQNIENINVLEALEILNLGSNQITKMPLIKNKNILELSLENNKIKVLNDNFDDNLEYLTLRNNQLKTIDSTIDFKSKKLLVLNLSFNDNLTSVPNNLLEMSYLRKLNLSSCNLEEWVMKKDLINKNLSELLLGSNQMKRFQINNQQLPNLIELQLSVNQLMTVEIKHQKITNLNLSANKLITYGLRLDLPFAKSVNLYDNELEALPEKCLIAPNLESLNLDRNYITDKQGKDIWYRFPKLVF